MKLLLVAASGLLLLAGRVAAQGDDEGDADVSTASPTAPAPTATPPAPPRKAPAAPKGLVVARAPAPAGQWVYTEQYAWIWIPYGAQYVSAPDNVEGAYPYTYVYDPAWAAWTWVYSPWVWGWGPMPYWGYYGAWRYTWYHGAGYYYRPWWYRGYYYGHGYYGGRWHGWRLPRRARARATTATRGPTEAHRARTAAAT
jgi:hypothetical protein